MSANFRPLASQLYTVPRCQVLFQLLDPNTYAPIAATRNVGDATMEADVKIEYMDIKSMEDSMHGIVASPAVDVQADLKLKLRQFDGFVSSLMFQAQYGQSVTLPAASPNQKATFTGVEVGGIYALRDATGQWVANPKINSVTDDATPPVPYPAGTYRVDLLTGRIEVDAMPTGVSQNLVVNFDIPAPAANPPALFGFLNAPEIYCKIDVRTNNRRGMDRWFSFPLCRVGLTSGFKMGVEGNEPESIELSGKVLFDGSQKPGFERGYIRDLNTYTAIGAWR